VTLTQIFILHQTENLIKKRLRLGFVFQETRSPALPPLKGGCPAGTGTGGTCPAARARLCPGSMAQSRGLPSPATAANGDKLAVLRAAGKPAGFKPRRAVCRPDPFPVLLGADFGK